MYMRKYIQKYFRIGNFLGQETTIWARFLKLKGILHTTSCQ